MEECIKHGILKDILPKEKGVIEDMITVCYDEEIHKMREAEYNQELGEERGKEIGKLLQPETIKSNAKNKTYHSSDFILLYDTFYLFSIFSLPDIFS